MISKIAFSCIFLPIYCHDRLFSVMGISLCLNIFCASFSQRYFQLCSADVVRRYLKGPPFYEGGHRFLRGATGGLGGHRWPLTKKDIPIYIYIYIYIFTWLV